MEKHYTIRLTAGDESLVIAPDAPCRLLAGGLTGFDGTVLDVAVRSFASRHGGYPERRRFAERELGLVFEIAADEAETERIRRRIVRMMNPAVSCEIDAEIYGVHRKIGVLPYGEVRVMRDTMHDRPEVSLEFLAPDVFFRAAETEEVIFRDPVPLLAAPMSFFAGAGLASGILRTTDTARIVNGGDTACGIVAEITADGGSVTSPGIACGEAFIRCPVVLSDGDTLTIDTRDRQKTITLNGERYFSFDRRSTFFRLPAGESSVTVLCEDGAEYVRAKLGYTPLYFGI